MLKLGFYYRYKIVCRDPRRVGAPPINDSPLIWFLSHNDSVSFFILQFSSLFNRLSFFLSLLSKFKTIYFSFSFITFLSLRSCPIPKGTLLPFLRFS
ncbi:unnamed protein product [Brassica rapa subsp. narinosa]